MKTMKFPKRGSELQPSRPRRHYKLLKIMNIRWLSSNIKIKGIKLKRPNCVLTSILRLSLTKVTLINYLDSVIRYSVPFKILPFSTFRWILEALRVDMQIGTARFASLPEQGKENIKYFIFSIGNRTHNLSRLQSLACAPAPRPASIKEIVIYFSHFIRSR